MAEEFEASAPAPRWLEFKAVRYAMGSVVGTLIVWFLWHTNRPLTNLIGEAPKFDRPATELVVIAVLGVVFCYVASAPILVLHALRYQIDIGGKTRLRHFLAYLVGTILLAVALLSLVMVGFYPVFTDG